MTAIGLRLNNPGHIERGDPWQGLTETPMHTRFASFTDPVWGLRAIVRTLITYYDNRLAGDGSKIDTVLEIVQRWAPPEDGNPTTEYARFLAKKVHKAVDETINVYDYSTMYGLVEGIVKFETGLQPYTKAQIDRAMELAGIVIPAPKPSKDPAIVTATTVAATSAVGAVVQSSDTILQALNTLVPLGRGYAITFSVATIVLALLAIRYRVGERKNDKQD